MRKIFIYDVNGNFNHMNIILGLESEEVKIGDAVKMMEKVSTVFLWDINEQKNCHSF